MSGGENSGVGIAAQCDNLILEKGDTIYYIREPLKHFYTSYSIYRLGLKEQEMEDIAELWQKETQRR